MSEIENGRLGLHGTEHLICNHLMTLGFKVNTAYPYVKNDKNMRWSTGYHRLNCQGMTNGESLVLLRWSFYKPDVIVVKCYSN